MVATVNGTTITLEEVEAIRAVSATTDRDQFNRDLFQLIVEETVRQAAAAQYSIVEDPAAVDAQYDLFIAGIEAEGPLDEYLETNGITEETIRHVAFQQVILPEIQVRLAEGTTEEDLQAAYAEVLPRLSTVCTRHILVATEEEGLAVIDRLGGGEEFADLAAELSIDTGSGAAGGDIGCISDPSTNLVASYATASLEAEIGQVTGPIESQFGYHVLIVDSRETPSLDEVRTDLTASLGADLFDAWVFENLGTADIVVTERYGTWQTEPSFGVVSPA
ncbi:MAG: peptidylprolyl isomerase [Acidimicrobiia bacterium]|nr:peptidylprolyl isomerase [Acidimicrobiia bacterium]